MLIVLQFFTSKLVLSTEFQESHAKTKTLPSMQNIAQQSLDKNHIFQGMPFKGAVKSPKL